MTRNETRAPRRPRRMAPALRALILDAAATEFEANGFAGATTAAIARRADVTEAQLFRLFGSKEAVFRAAVFEPLNRHFAGFMAEAASHTGLATSRDELAGRYTAELYDFMERHSRMLMSLIVASSHGGRSASGLEEVGGIIRYFDRGAALMTARLGEDSREEAAVAVRLAFAAVLGTVLFGPWLFQNDVATPELVRTSLVDFVVHGTRSSSA